MSKNTALNTVKTVTTKAHCIYDKFLRFVADNPQYTSFGITALGNLQQYANDYSDKQAHSPNSKSNYKTPIVEISFDKNQAA